MAYTQFKNADETVYPQFTEEHEIFRKALRDYIEKEVVPHVDEWEEKEFFSDDVFRQMGKLGFLGVSQPEDKGGAGGDYWMSVVYAEEMTRMQCGGIPMAMMVQTDMATPIIAQIGTDEQVENYLKPAYRGEKIFAIAVSEPDAGSDVAAIKTTAKRDGDDYIINGSKTFITNGVRADYLTLLAKTDPDKGAYGTSLFIFPTDTEGYEVGKKLKKVGQWASDTATLYFDNCRIPKEMLLGEENMGFYYQMQNFQVERLIACVAACAGSRLTYEETKNYASERMAFGKPIGKFQVQKHRLVEMLTRIEAAKAFTYHCADLYNRNINCVKEISMCKVVAGETSVWVADQAMQIYGGAGYTEEHRISRAWRDSRLITIGGGTTEIMREIIAKLEGI